MLIPILSIFFLFIAFLCKRDKKALFLLWVFMIIIIIMNTNNADWDAYKFMYGVINRVDQSTLTDVGYGFLNYLAHHYLHLSFFQFRAIYTFLGMVILAAVILLNSPLPALTLALYFIAPFFPNDIIQIRNFVAQVILSAFWIKGIKSGRSWPIWFVIGTALATTMHATSIYFLIFIVLLFVKDPKKLYIVSVISSLFVGALPTILRLIPFISMEKINYYLGATSSSIDVRGLIIICVDLAQTFLIHQMRDEMLVTNDKLYSWCNFVYKIDVLCLPACVIMTVWSFNFYRVPRNMLLINYITYSKYLYEKKDQKLLNVYTVIFILAGLCWSMLNSFSQWSVIWNNNWLIRW